MFEIFFCLFEQILLYLPLAAGAYLALSIMKIPNLGLEAAFVFGGFCGAACLPMLNGQPLLLQLFLVCLASMLGGAFVGLVTGVVANFGKISHLLASILVVGFFYSINLFLIGGAIYSFSSQANPMMILALPGHPEFISLFLINICILALIFLLLKTQIGTCMSVYGNNPLFFGHYKISTNFIVLVGLALSNAFVGLSGYLISQSSGFIDVNAGSGLSLFCISALIIGRALQSSGRPVNSLIPFIGVAVYCLMQQLLLKTGFNLKYFTAVQAVVVFCLLVVCSQKKSSQDNLKDVLGI
jgi:putative ABC transport system permease protein